MICDGVLTHINLAVLEKMRAAGLRVVLRCPHTTHVTQTEDLVTFGVAKPEFRWLKSQVIIARMMLVGIKELKLSDVRLHTLMGPSSHPQTPHVENVREWSIIPISGGFRGPHVNPCAFISPRTR